MTTSAVRLIVLLGAMLLLLLLPAGPLPTVGAGVAHAAAKKGGTRARGARKGRGRHVFLERRVAATKGGQPNVQALGALVIDENGREVFARHADRERPIASISKLAASLVIAGKGLELEGLTTITRDDVEVAKGGARSRLLEGMTLSNRDLLHAALMGSDNRAVPALGRAVKLSPSQLTSAMNAKARELGLKGTRFREPTGLSPENVSTPREIIIMLRAAMAQPMLAAVIGRGEYEAHPVGRPPIRYVNTDRPAQRSNVQVMAGKTGYNDVARYCLVIATRVDGRPYYMAFLANEGKLTRFGDVARVADWVVSHKPKTPTLVAAPEAPSAVATGLPVGVAAPPPTANP